MNIMTKYFRIEETRFFISKGSFENSTFGILSTSPTHRAGDQSLYGTVLQDPH